MFTYESEEPDVYIDENHVPTDPNTVIWLQLIVLFFGWAATKNKKE